jgi:hypothetical protein
MNNMELGAGAAAFPGLFGPWVVFPNRLFKR